MRIECKYGSLACYDNIAIDNIYSVDINKNDKTIEFNGIDGFVIAWITHYDDNSIEEVEVIEEGSQILEGKRMQILYIMLYLLLRDLGQHPVMKHLNILLQ